MTSTCSPAPFAPPPSWPRRWFGSRDGTVGLAFAILAPTLILAAGLAVDLARITQARAVLQSIADSAALKGVDSYDLKNDVGCGATSSAAEAAATAFVTAAAPQLNSLYNVSLPASGITVSALYDDTGCGADSTTSVVLTAQIVHSLTAYFMGSFGLTASATATNPNVNFQFIVLAQSNLSGSNDIDSFGFYPSTGIGQDEPDPSSIFWFWTNSSTGGKVRTQTSAVKRPYLSTQLLSFALDNVTGGRVPISGTLGDPLYSGSNCYGSMPGTEHTFYSNMSPPNYSATALPYGAAGPYLATTPLASCTNDNVLNGLYSETITVATNNSFRTTLNGDVSNPANWVTNTGWTPVSGVTPATPRGITTATLTPYGTLSCAQLGSNVLDIAWNDMGTSIASLNVLGVTVHLDQLAYNSVYATVSCKGVTATAIRSPWLSG